MSLGVYYTTDNVWMCIYYLLKLPLNPMHWSYLHFTGKEVKAQKIKDFLKITE